MSLLKLGTDAACPRCSSAHTATANLSNTRFAPPIRRGHTSSRSQNVVSNAVPQTLIETAAGINPYTLQDIIVGGAVVGAVSAALFAGLRKEPVVCDLCQGTGGARCFVCGGEGKMPSLISREELMEGQTKRDMFGRSGNNRSCKVCKGAGLVGCSKCKGSGYVPG
mmetsp:Transcript_16484/g.35637  ORF Transcript_16484/g.35637 Transcript_16484/m.35637 type:complete len:166 (+) Transcript_16484:29-526(+)